MSTMEDLLGLSPVVPVVEVQDVAHAVPLARALERGGVPVVEITLRTDAALDAVREIRRQVPGLVVGVGTVVDPAQADAARRAGAQFLVTPGTTDALLEAATATGLPVLPGVATVGEMLRLRERGVRAMKLFPAEACGGRALLASVAGPLPDLLFCPTGGIGEHAVAGYLELPNVACVGGSWVTPAADLAAGRWDVVEDLARRAASSGASAGSS